MIDIDTIIEVISGTIAVLGILSGLAINHYYSWKAIHKNRLSQSEFNKAIILVAVTTLIGGGGMGCGILTKEIVNSQTLSVSRAIGITLLCLALPTFFVTSMFVWEFKRKDLVRRGR